MKTLIVFVSLLFFNFLLSAQDITDESLGKTIDSLQKIVDKNDKQADSLKSVNAILNEEIKKHKVELGRILIEKQDGIVYVCTFDAYLYDSPELYHKNLAAISKGDKIKVLEDVDDFYFKVNFNGLTGYVYKSGFISESEQQKKLEKEKYYEKKKLLADQQRKNDLIKKYGQTNGTKIFEGRIWIGMTKEMVLESWGQPEDINRTVGEWGVHEQLIYGKTYVYIENGKLTSWQD